MQTVGTGPFQSGHPASGAKVDRLSAGCGQKRSTLPGSDSAANTGKRHQNKKKKASLDRQSRLAAEIPSLRSVSDPPAGPRVCGDCARELPLPIHPTVCFEVGRSALTQSSRPMLTQRCSRKWMSGHAAHALVLSEDRGQFATPKPYPSGEHLPPSRGESPLPLDCYLSWMSPLFTSEFLLPLSLQDWLPEDHLSRISRPRPREFPLHPAARILAGHAQLAQSSTRLCSRLSRRLASTNEK